MRHDRSLTHDWIWSALDTLAERHGLTPSSLARLAGLDPTTFNRSKRFTPEGRPRWPSTESISKVLKATGTTLDEFASLELATRLEISFDETAEGDIPGVPVVGVVRHGAVAGWEPLDDAGGPQGDGTHGPAVAPRRFALAVVDNSLEPAYGAGNTLVVSEAAAPRAGDRVLVKPAGSPVVPRLLVRATPQRLELTGFGPSPQRLAVRRRDIDWIARIVLVRQ